MESIPNMIENARLTLLSQSWYQSRNSSYLSILSNTLTKKMSYQKLYQNKIIKQEKVPLLRT